MSIIVLLPVVLVVLIMGLGIGIVMIIAGLKMMSLTSYRWAMAGSIAALLPVSPINLLGLAAGIWSLVVLNRRNVKEAFHTPAPAQRAQEPSETGRGVRTGRRRWLGAALVLLSLILTAFWFAPAMLAPVTNLFATLTNKGKLEIDCDDEIKGAKVLVLRGGQQVTLIDAEARPWAYLEPGLYQLQLVSGWRAPPGKTAGEFVLSSSTVTVSGGGSQVLRVFIREDKTVKGPAPPPEPSCGWIMGSGGPALTDAFARFVLKLRPDQVAAVNAALQDIHREYLALEEQNAVRRTDEAGHVVTIIKPFSGPLTKLEDRLWSGLDAILDSQQQGVARLNLRLHPKLVQPPIALSEIVAPGFFGWGKDGAQIEIWRVGSWFHWRVSTRGYTDSEQREPQLPDEYRRFWTDATPQPEKD